MSGGGGGGGDSQDVVEDEEPALHGRGPVGIRGDREHGPLRQHSAARAPGGQCHPAHLVALDALDPVVLRQPLVEERVVAVDQLEQAAVVPHDVLEEHLGFPPHRPPQVAGQLELAEPAERAEECRCGSASALSSPVGQASRAACGSAREIAPGDFSASGSGGWSREMTAKALISTESMSRACSHWPTKLPEELLGPRVGEHPLDLGVEVRPELVLAARRNSSSSGMDDQRK